MRMWYVYPGGNARNDFWHCVRARDQAGAIRAAKLWFRIERDAFAWAPSDEQRAADLHDALRSSGGYVTPTPTLFPTRFARGRR